MSDLQFPLTIVVETQTAFNILTTVDAFYFAEEGFHSVHNSLRLYLQYCESVILRTQKLFATSVSNEGFALINLVVCVDLEFLDSHSNLDPIHGVNSIFFLTDYRLRIYLSPNLSQAKTLPPSLCLKRLFRANSR